MVFSLGRHRRWIIVLIVALAISAAVVAESPKEGLPARPVFYPYDAGIVYMLPSGAASPFWMQNYGDRTEFYIYSNITLQSKPILNDLGVISKEYRFVVRVMPLDDSAFFYYNLRVFDSWAASKGLKVLYAFFPKSKYGPERTYLNPGSPVNARLIHDMLYVSNLTSTAEIAVWYGWADAQVNVTEILNFYDSLPAALEAKYSVWLDGSFVADAVKAGFASFADSHNLTVITELYSQGYLSQFGYAFRKQIVVSGVSGAASIGDWEKKMSAKLDSVKVPGNYTQYDLRKLAVWIYWDRNDGSGEKYTAYLNGTLVNPQLLPTSTTVALDGASPNQSIYGGAKTPVYDHSPWSNSLVAAKCFTFGSTRLIVALTLCVSYRVEKPWSGYRVVGEVRQSRPDAY